MRILVVDDSPSFSEVLKLGLKAAGGHEVDAYPTAAEALAALDYALALVEYSGDGREFLHAYQDVDPLLAVVVLTSLPSQASAVEFLRGGSRSLAVDYIIKPEPDLIRRLVEIIDERYGRVTQGDWMVDRATGLVTYRDRPVELTPTETAMFTYFMLHPYEEVQHEELWHAARGEWLDRPDAVSTTRAHLSRLRARLEAVAGREVIHSRHKGPFRFLPRAVAEMGVAGGREAGYS